MASLKLDENMPDAAAEILRSAGHDVALARDEALAGEDDDRLAAVASAEGRVLVTLDVDFADIRRHPPAGTPGLVVIRLHRQTVGLMRRAAIALGDFLLSEPITGKLWIVDESRLRVWPDW